MFFFLSRYICWFFAPYFALENLTKNDSTVAVSKLKTKKKRPTRHDIKSFFFALFKNLVSLGEHEKTSARPRAIEAKRKMNFQCASIDERRRKKPILNTHTPAGIRSFSLLLLLVLRLIRCCACFSLEYLPCSLSLSLSRCTAVVFLCIKNPSRARSSSKFI